MRDDVRLVERRRVNDAVHTGEAVPDDLAIGDRSDHRGEVGGQYVETDDVAALSPQDADECFAKVTGRAGHEDFPPVHQPDDRGPTPLT